MEPIMNENYEELKQGTKTILQIITSDDVHYGIFLLILMIILIKVIDLIFYPFKRRGNIMISFLKACLKVLVIATIGMRICALIPILSDFTSQILMSSSLIVVVMGFVFQEGLTNIVHGFILSVFKPFKIGDRVHLTIDGETITGFIVSMDVRHTVIRNVINSSHVIIPNSKMDMCMIENNYFDGNHTTSSFLDVEITYGSDIDKAMYIISETIMNHPYVQKLREMQKTTVPVKVMVRELAETGIRLRAGVVTETVDENFAACSDIRYCLVKTFTAEPDVEFAYPHIVTISKQERSEQNLYEQNLYGQKRSGQSGMKETDYRQNTGEYPGADPRQNAGVIPGAGQAAE